jgi:hypothetical protein
MCVVYAHRIAWRWRYLIDEEEEWEEDAEDEEWEEEEW